MRRGETEGQVGGVRERGIEEESERVGGRSKRGEDRGGEKGERRRGGKK